MSAVVALAVTTAPAGAAAAPLAEGGVPKVSAASHDPVGVRAVAHSGSRAADTVLRNGFVYTVDRHNSVAKALAVRNGRIVYVGTNKGVKKYIGKQTRVIDLDGRMVMPGLIDAHIHPDLAGAALVECNLQYQPLTVEQFKAHIQACLDESSADEPDKWLVVQNWYRQAMQPAGTEVTKADLDVLSTDRPIMVFSSDGHTKLVNSRALDLAHITADTPDPAGGRIDKGPDGQPTGILEDAAGWMVAAMIPPPTQPEVNEQMAATTVAMSQQGITAFMGQAADDSIMTGFEHLRATHSLTTRAFMAPDVPQKQRAKPKAAVRELEALRRKYDTGRLRPRPGVSVHNVGELGQDGVIQWPAQTASLLRPYLINKGSEAHPRWVPGPSRGPDPYTSLKTLRRLVVALGKAGFDPEIHAIGDRAVRHVLDAYEWARARLHGKDVRLQIAHAELVAPKDYKRFRKLDVTVDMGFQWAKPGPDSIDGAKNFLGRKRFNRMEPEGYLYRAGARLAQGSDWPVDPINEFFDMEVLVTRKGDLGGPYAGRLGTVPGVPVKAAIRMFTINGAYALHAENQIGSLEPGKLADLTVVNQNLVRIPARKISDTKVLLTMVGGKKVYQAPHANLA